MLKLLHRLRRKLSKAATARTSVEVGWVIAQRKSSMIWDDPKPLLRRGPRPASAKSVMLCPAAIDFDAKHFVVPCPIDVRLRIKLEDGKAPSLENVDGIKSTVRSKALSQMVSVIQPCRVAASRTPDPAVPHAVCVSFRRSHLPQSASAIPPLHAARLAGTLISGRFPIHVWPRHLMWAFEWHDVSEDLVLTRGYPWFYVRFEANDPSRPVRLVEAELTPALENYIEAIGGVTNYVNRTFSMFDRAARRQPAKLLQRRITRQTPRVCGQCIVADQHRLFHLT